MAVYIRIKTAGAHKRRSHTHLFSCAYCRQIFPSDKLRYKHHATHHEKMRCEERGCVYKYRTLARMREHMNDVHGKSLHLECSKCARVFSRNTDRTRHFKYEHMSGRHKCTVTGCECSYTKRDHLDRHIKRVHGNLACVFSS